MRTTVNLDNDVYEVAVQHAKASGKSLGKALSDLVRRSLKVAEPPLPAPGRRFPVFAVPSDAQPISLAKAAQFLDEEGLV